jgi:hypothetical protein
MKEPEEKTAVVKVGGKTPEAWKGYIATGLKKTVDATLDTAKRIAAYRAVVEDTAFKNDMKEWFGFSLSHLSYWAKISDTLPRFESAINLIPASPRSLYELAAFNEEDWNTLVANGQIKPSLTVEGIKELRATGGVVKQFLLKYGESPDFFDINRKAQEFQAQGMTGKEVVTAMTKWLKENPPERPPAKLASKAVQPEKSTGPANDFSDLEDDDEEEDFSPPVYAQGAKPIAGTLVEARPNKMEALALFGIFINKPLDNMAVERALVAIAGDDETLLVALEVIMS